MRPSIKLMGINMDCADTKEMARFYGELLGFEIVHRDGGFIVMRDPAGGPTISFDTIKNYRSPRWPEEPNAQDKMMHFEMSVDDLEAAVAHAIACGAKQAEYQGLDHVRVMLDPAGHPFCLCFE
jgi:catechol 2,3-dioxygenase-like lactoylglutathione lyase family enzyme